MVDYTNVSNINLGKLIASKNNADEKSVVYFGIAYAVFNVIESNIADKSIIANNQPSFLNIIRRVLNDINELSPIDTDVVRNYILKFAEYYNAKISRDFLAATNIYSIFNIDAIFGFGLLDLVNKNLELFKDIAKHTIVSKVVADDLINKFLIGE